MYRTYDHYRTQQRISIYVMSVFNEIPIEQYILEGDYFFVIRDKYPVSPGHALIISKRTCEQYFDLNETEKSELTAIIDQTKQAIEKVYSPDGYNIGMNCGSVAGQTVMHFHCHVIPRYIGDMEDPRGGVRGVIPKHQKY
jgi:diadenosine tetraphosphate (Ap4A) HIT family hydrolase